MAKKSKGSVKKFWVKFDFNAWMNDEKLKECSASTVGVYSYLFCFFCHVQCMGRYRINPVHIAEVAEFLPRQNPRQSNQQSERQNISICRAFAGYFSRHLPYTSDIIAAAFFELLINDVLYLEDGCICQKRMIRDAELSAKRSKSGGKGAEVTNQRFKEVALGAEGQGQLLPNDLPGTLPELLPRQNPNSISISKYIEGDRGVSNNMEGGAGEQKSGGKEEDRENLPHALDATDLQIISQMNLPEGDKTRIIEIWSKWITYLRPEAESRHKKMPTSVAGKSAAIQYALQLADYKISKLEKIVQKAMGSGWVTLQKLDPDEEQSFSKNGVGKIPGQHATQQETDDYYSRVPRNS